MLHEYPVVKYKTITRVRSGDEPLLSGEERESTEDERDTEKPLVEHNYDWSLQYLPGLQFGWLVLEGVNKTVQESLASEHLDSGGVFPVLVLPVVPFITKFNRYIVLGLLVVGKFGNNFKAIPDGFSKKRATTSTRSIMLGMRVEVECYGGYGAGLPGGGALQSELGDLGEQREGLVGVVKHVDV